MSGEAFGRSGMLAPYSINDLQIIYRAGRFEIGIGIAIGVDIETDCDSRLR